MKGAHGSAAFADEEALLPKMHALSVVRGDDGSQHDWDGHFCHCCGDCGVLGWASCLLAHSCPCIAYGLNMKRVFSASALLNGLLILILVALGYVQHIVSVLDLENGCTSAPPALRVKGGFCDRLLTWKLVASVVNIVYCGCLVFYLAKRRTQIREKFGIPGTKLGDCCIWFWCSTCALCQETRTLWHNNVQAGIWHGPTVNVSVAQVETMAPIVPTIDSRV